MGKIGFAGFGEVNTPVDVIVRKCKAAEEALKEEGFDLLSVYPIADDREEKQVTAASEKLMSEPLDALVVCVAGWIPTHAVVKVTEHFRHLPIVLWGLCGWYEGDTLVTTADQAAEIECLTLGAIDFIPKPYPQPKVILARMYFSA